MCQISIPSSTILNADFIIINNSKFIIQSLTVMAVAYAKQANILSLLIVG
jgi:hypothetical protein